MTTRAGTGWSSAETSQVRSQRPEVGSEGFSRRLLASSVLTATSTWDALPPPRSQTVEVHDRVPHHPVAADCFATIDGIVREEHDVALLDRDVDNYRLVDDV